METFYQNNKHTSVVKLHLIVDLCVCECVFYFSEISHENNRTNDRQASTFHHYGCSFYVCVCVCFAGFPT